MNDAINKRLPQTAIEALEPIIQTALQEGKHAEAAKAIALKITMEGSIQGDKPEERIIRLQAVMADLPLAIQPVMETILAHWYWQYFQENRWRFMQRTQLQQPAGTDLTAWDLPRILAEIDRHFTIALSQREPLQRIPVGDFDDLLLKGTVPDSHRPTLFDFVAHEALSFYTAGEQAGSTARDAFVLQADSPIFASLDEFLAWQPASPDTDSPLLKAIGIYQQLLTFHRHDSDGSALADADLGRLAFGFNQAFGEEKNARYKAALERFSQQWSTHPIVARAWEAWGRVLQSEEQLVDAHQLAQRGWKTFPDSPGGQLCYNLLQDIEAREVQVTVEQVWNQPWPAIQVQYRNLTRLHFRAIRLDWHQLVQSENFFPRRIDQEAVRGWLAKRPDLQWSHDLPATEDFRQAQEQFPVPDQLPPGYYVLLASPHEQFREQDNQVLASDFWVSPLALVLRTGVEASRIEGFVLDAESGEPLENARVRSWSQQRVGRGVRWVEGRSANTDKNGLFRIDGEPGQPCLILARHGEHELASSNAHASYDGRPSHEPYQQTIFFTDRALYRPGQTIRFKGICILVDHQRDNYETRANESVTVIFEDVNGQPIEELACRANAWGSFSGSFTAPRDRLMGQMRLRDPQRPNSMTQFNVEEYKRPKFKVELAAPKEPAKLGAEVSVEGTAKAYTGAAIGEAQVAYRVVREVRYPIWWYWRCWWNPPRAASQEIAHGTTTTDPDGKFTVTFPAQPDPSVSEKDEPVFHFTVHADVTDTTGETRTAQRVVNVGFTALQASLTADEWQTADRPVTLTISTRSLDGEPRAATGKVRVYQLQQPERVQRPSLQPVYFRWRGGRIDSPPPSDPANPDSWALGELLSEREFTTDASGTVQQTVELPAGPARALLETEDGLGKMVTAVLPLQVLDPKSERFAIKVPSRVAAPRWSLQPGDTFMALWGTGYEQGRAYVEIEHRGKLVQSYWTRTGVTQAAIEQGVTEAMRGGFTLRVTQVRENRAYFESRSVQVPWSNKDLTIRWEQFTSKLAPGEERVWTAIISGDKATQVAAEMVATLYDASLDAYLPHSWPGLNVFRADYSSVRQQFENAAQPLYTILGQFHYDRKGVLLTYRHFPPDIIGHGMFVQERMMMRGRGGMGGGMAVPMAAPAADMADGAPGRAMDALAFGAPAEAESMAVMAKGADATPGGLGGDAGGPVDGATTTPGPDLSQVSARTNLNETAFFFPHLSTDGDGRIKLEFKMPEALTEWKFYGLAHDKSLRSGLLTDTVVTAKDLMVEPLAPRFLREGDVLEFTVKVTNQSPTRQTGTVRLTLADARTLEGVDSQLGNVNTDQTFDVPSQESRSYSWRLSVPDGMGFLTYKAVGSSGRLSDGEEGFLPVLSRRILVTESLPLPIRGQTTRQFEMRKLLESGQSDSLRHQSLTVQMVSNPAWYAVMALPYLMEFPYECTEQTFNRLYANALAQHIAQSDPKIRRIFDQWKGTEALDSPLEKNDELKAVMLQETPWMRQALSESQARRNVGILFDANRLQDELTRGLRQLAEQQDVDGSWPWFPGGRPNDFITLYITTGFGRLRHLGAAVDVSMAVRSLARLDAWIDETYRRIVARGDKNENHLSATIALYLYGRSFFLDDMAVEPQNQEAVNYFLEQARTHWTKLANRQSEGHLAIALKRFGDRKTAAEIVKSLKERAVNQEEMGMFWRDTERSWWWYRAPIETQAMMIEVFDEVANDVESVEACRVWLLKQKQTQDWKTTKATADAIYSLLLRGTDLLASDVLVRVSLGGTPIEPRNVEAGTGFYEQRFAGGEIVPAMGRVEVVKSDPGVAWGSLHWQYLEDMSKVTPYEGTPLTLRKQLFVKLRTDRGPVLKAVDGPLHVGDELVVRIELRVDRDMEYVHMKDQRGSGIEPVNVLSRYQYQDGLAYYESTRDTASHFFIDYLPKGTYVFEYSARVVHRGQYQSGMAEIQSMYAPEFNSHSESFPLTVQ